MIEKIRINIGWTHSPEKHLDLPCDDQRAGVELIDAFCRQHDYTDKVATYMKRLLDDALARRELKWRVVTADRVEIPR